VVWHGRPRLGASTWKHQVRTFALEAAREATVLLEEYEDLARNLAVNAVVDQIHSSAVDILRSTGMDRGAALQALWEVTGRTSAG
jgi:hypothetical protein